jgi:hypothetical protein
LKKVKVNNLRMNKETGQALEKIVSGKYLESGKVSLQLFEDKSIETSKDIGCL